MLAVICVLIFLFLVAVLILYITKTDTRQYEQILFYSDEVTLRAGKPIDLRFHDKVKLSLQSLEDSNNNIKYTVSTCQADCNNDIVASKDVSSDQNVQFLVPAQTRQYMKFDSIDRASIPTIFMLKDSHIDMNFSSQGASTGTFLTLNVFKDVRDCESFRVSMEGIIPSQVIPLTPSQYFSYTFHPKTENGDFYCIVMESPPNISYSYHLNGIVYQYKSVERVCANVTPHNFNLEHVNTINVTLQRSLKSVSSVWSQKACVLVTFHKQGECSFNICPVGMNTTVYGTRRNIKVVSLSTLALFALATALTFTFTFCVLCIKS